MKELLININGFLSKLFQIEYIIGCFMNSKLQLKKFSVLLLEIYPKPMLYFISPIFSIFVATPLSSESIVVELHNLVVLTALKTNFFVLTTTPTPRFQYRFVSESASVW